MFRLKSLVLSLAAVAAASTWTVALADATAVSAGEESTAAMAVPAASNPFGGAVLDAESLDGQRGTADLLLSKMDLESKVHDNYAENVATVGTNSIDGAAFTNFNGIALGVQNNGSQVSIQNAVSVIIQLK